MNLEEFEHLAQESVGEQHAAALNLDAGDVVLGGHGLDFPVFEVVVDDGAWCRGIHRVEQAYGHSGELGRLDTCGMEYLGTEVGQLGCLLEVQLAHGLGVVHDAGVVVVHAVDVGPYLDFLGLQGGAQEAGGVVGPSAQQVVNLAVGVAADEALCDIERVVGIVLEYRGYARLDVVEVRFGILVRAHDVERIEQDGFHVHLQQQVGHHVGADDFALCQDYLLLE